MTLPRWLPGWREPPQCRGQARIRADCHSHGRLAPCQIILSEISHSPPVFDPPVFGQ